MIIARLLVLLILSTLLLTYIPTVAQRALATSGSLPLGRCRWTIHFYTQYLDAVIVGGVLIPDVSGDDFVDLCVVVEYFSIDTPPSYYLKVVDPVKHTICKTVYITGSERVAGVFLTGNYLVVPSNASVRVYDARTLSRLYQIPLSGRACAFRMSERGALYMVDNDTVRCIDPVYQVELWSIRLSRAPRPLAAALIDDYYIVAYANPEQTYLHLCVLANGTVFFNQSYVKWFDRVWLTTPSSELLLMRALAGWPYYRSILYAYQFNTSTAELQLRWQTEVSDRYSLKPTPTHDLSGDGVPEILIATPSDRCVVVDGSTGAYLFDTGYTLLPEGGLLVEEDILNDTLREFLVGTYTLDYGSVTAVFSINASFCKIHWIGYGHPLVLIPDLSGDGYPDLITVNNDAALGCLYCFAIGYDPSPPQLRIVQPRNGTLVPNGSSITFSVEVVPKLPSDRRVFLRVYYDEVEMSPTENPHIWTATINITVRPWQSHCLPCYAYVPSQYTRETLAQTPSIYIYIDCKPPSLELLQPSNGSQILNGSVSLAWNASDDFGLAKTYIYANTTLYAVLPPLPNGSFTLHGLSDGFWNLTVVVEDHVGWRNASTVWVFVDGSPPTVRILAPEAFTITNRTWVVVEAYAEDAGSNVTQVQVLVNGTVVKEEAVNASQYSLETPVHFSDEGWWAVAVAAQDGSGKRALYSTLVLVDRTPPTPLFVTPFNDANVTPGKLTIAFVFSDNLSGVRSVAVRWDDHLIAELDQSYGMLSIEVSEGLHTLTLTAWDHAGNAAVVRCSVNATAPAVTPEVPEERPSTLQALTAPSTLLVAAIAALAAFTPTLILLRRRTR